MAKKQILSSQNEQEKHQKERFEIRQKNQTEYVPMASNYWDYYHHSGYFLDFIGLNAPVYGAFFQT